MLHSPTPTQIVMDQLYLRTELGGTLSGEGERMDMLVAIIAGDR